MSQWYKDHFENLVKEGKEAIVEHVNPNAYDADDLARMVLEAVSGFYVPTVENRESVECYEDEEDVK